MKIARVIVLLFVSFVCADEMVGNNPKSVEYEMVYKRRGPRFVKMD
jgi:hypothetical protein